MKRIHALPLAAWALAVSALTALADVHFSGVYHNNTNLNPETEQVPDTNAPVKFFRELDYANNLVHYYVLTESPAVNTDETASVRIRLFSNLTTEFQEAQLITNVVLSTNTVTFHGTPTNGSELVFTADVWKASWEPQHGFTGNVFYAPQIRSFYLGLETDQQYLLGSIGGNAGAQWGSNDFFWATNAQALGDSPFGLDYSFVWTNKLPFNFDNIYFNGTNAGLPQSEDVPGLGGVKFLDWHYETNQPSYAYVLAPTNGITAMNTRFYYGGGPAEVVVGAAKYTNVVIDSGAPFHGLPAAGAITLAVWRSEFWPPSGWSGDVFYAHQITTPKDGTTWLVRDFDSSSPAGIGITNNWPTAPQFFYTDFPYDRDWSFTPTAAIVRASLDRNYAYFNNAASFNPQTELIPVIAGGTNFLEVNYVNTQTTFYVMTRHFANLVPGEGVSVQMRLAWSTNNLDNYVEEYPAMTFDQNIVLSSGTPFHGLPSAGSATVDLWKLDWKQPTNSLGQPYTNAINVYFAPLLKTTAGSGAFQTDYTYLLKGLGVGVGYGSNDYPVAGQLYGPVTFGNDYVYTNVFISNVDTDGDGLTDAEEALLGTSSILQDTDNDQQTDAEEVVAGSSPTLSNSVFKVQAVATAAGGQVRLDWSAITGRLYNVERAVGAYGDSASFVVLLTNVTVPADGTLQTNVPAPDGQATYRLRVQKP
jgi:hypothetical protein